MSVIDEAELRRMTQAERHELARILAAIDLPHPLVDRCLRLRRRFGLLFLTACCVGLAFWIAILILTLPDRFTSSDWRAVWVGLDVAELIGFAAVGWAALRQRQVLIFFMIMTGTLLLCDAWFDLALSYGSSGFTMSVVSAVLAEFPLAFLMFAGARRLVRVTVQTVMELAGICGEWRWWRPGSRRPCPPGSGTGPATSRPRVSQSAAASRLSELSALNDALGRKGLACQSCSQPRGPACSAARWLVMTSAMSPSVSSCPGVSKSAKQCRTASA